MPEFYLTILWGIHLLLVSVYAWSRGPTGKKRRRRYIPFFFFFLIIEMSCSSLPILVASRVLLFLAKMEYVV